MPVVLFDVDGVLVHGYHARPERRQCWDEHLQRDFSIDRERFKNEFILGPFVQEVIVGKRSLKEALASVLPALGFNGDPQTLIDYWLRNDANLNRELLVEISALKRSGRVRLFIATNQEHLRAQYLMNEMGLGEYFDGIFYSARIGHCKPSAEYFGYISRALKLSDNEKPLLFDDTPSVIAGAKAFGWDAIEFVDSASLHESALIRGILAGSRSE
jgi:putative hydrolase of the HAD superfamily